MRLDVSRFIEEVRKRPLLWNLRYLNKRNNLWSEVAKTLEVSVYDCKRKWKTLCLLYESSKGKVKKRRRKNGPYAKDTDTLFLNHLKFLDDKEEVQILDEIEDVQNEDMIEDVQFVDNIEDVQIVDEIVDVQIKDEIEDVQILDNIEDGQILDEIEDVQILDKKDDVQYVDNIEDVQIVDDIEDDQIVDEIEDVQIVNEIEDVQIVNEKEDIQIVNQIKDNESDTLLNKSASTNVQNDLQQKVSLPAKFDIADLDCSFLISFIFYLQSMSKTQNLKFRTKMSELMLSFLNPKEIDEGDSTNTLEHINDRTFFKALINIGDSNYDFLLSYLPYVKSLPRLENMHFRVKMSDLLLDILSF